MEAARSGEGRAVAVIGEPGIGKTRVTREALGLATASGMSVMRGSCIPESTEAYRPFSEALAGWFPSAAVESDPGVRPFRDLLDRLLPDRDGSSIPVDASTIAMSEAILRVMRAVAGSAGGLVVLDDMHWADAGTAAVAAYLVDHVRELAVVLLLATRDEDDAAVVQMIRRASARRSIDVLELARLNEAEVAAMVAERAGAASGVLQSVEAAEGVPFFIEELLVTQGLPRSFADSVRMRLDALGSDTLAVVRAAAVLGRRFDWTLLAATAEVEPGVIAPSLRSAVGAGLLDPGGRTENLSRHQGFAFRHGLSRDAVLATLFPPERVALARRALDAVETAHPDLAGEWAGLAATLARQAGDDRHATELAVGAAARAVRSGTLTTAIDILDQVLPSAPESLRPLVVVRLVEVLATAGQGNRAVELADALSEGGEPADPQLRADLAVATVQASATATRWADAATRLDPARSAAAAADDTAALARLDVLAGRIALGLDDLPGAEAAARRGLSTAQQHRLDAVVCEAWEVIGRVRRPSDLDEAETAFSTARQVAVRAGLSMARLSATTELGTIELLRSGSIDQLEAARDLAIESGALTMAANLDVQICGSLAPGDDPERALAPAREAAEICARYGIDQLGAVALGFEAMVHGRAGRADQMRDCLASASELAHGDASAPIIAASAKAMLAFALEDLAAARRAVHPIEVRSQGPLAGWYAILGVLDPVTADSVATEVAGWDPNMHFMGRGHLLHAEAIRFGRAGDEEAALDRLAQAWNVFDGFDWHRHHGRRLVAQAAIADGWGDPGPWLRSAEEWFHARSEAAIASACRSLLRLAGEPVPRRRRREGDVAEPARSLGITVREAEVVGLLASGLRNDEIAARLFMSTRTVERHVSNAAAKAGVERCAQLIALAASWVAAGWRHDT